MQKCLDWRQTSNRCRHRQYFQERDQRSQTRDVQRWQQRRICLQARLAAHSHHSNCGGHLSAHHHNILDYICRVAGKKKHSLNIYTDKSLNYITSLNLQRNSNHISRNSVRYRKINGRKCDAGNEARFIFNVGENGDDSDDNTDDDQDDLDVNTMRSNNKRIVYEQQQQHHNNGNEFFMKSTNDIDAIEFHGSSKGVNNPKMNTDCSSPTYMNPPTSSSSSSSNNRRINSRNNVQS